MKKLLFGFLFLVSLFISSNVFAAGPEGPVVTMKDKTGKQISFSAIKKTDMPVTINIAAGDDEIIRFLDDKDGVITVSRDYGLRPRLLTIKEQNGKYNVDIDVMVIGFHTLVSFDAKPYKSGEYASVDIFSIRPEVSEAKGQTYTVYGQEGYTSFIMQTDPAGIVKRLEFYDAISHTLVASAEIKDDMIRILDSDLEESFVPMRSDGIIDNASTVKVELDDVSWPQIVAAEATNEGGVLYNVVRHRGKYYENKEETKELLLSQERIHYYTNIIKGSPNTLPGDQSDKGRPAMWFNINDITFLLGSGLAEIHSTNPTLAQSIAEKLQLQLLSFKYEEWDFYEPYGAAATGRLYLLVDDLGIKLRPIRPDKLTEDAVYDLGRWLSMGGKDSEREAALIGPEEALMRAIYREARDLHEDYDLLLEEFLDMGLLKGMILDKNYAVEGVGIALRLKSEFEDNKDSKNLGRLNAVAKEVNMPDGFELPKDYVENFKSSIPEYKEQASAFVTDNDLEGILIDFLSKGLLRVIAQVDKEAGTEIINTLYKGSVDHYIDDEDIRELEDIAKISGITIDPGLVNQREADQLTSRLDGIERDIIEKGPSALIEGLPLLTSESGKTWLKEGLNSKESTSAKNIVVSLYTIYTHPNFVKMVKGNQELINGKEEFRAELETMVTENNVKTQLLSSTERAKAKLRFETFKRSITDLDMDYFTDPKLGDIRLNAYMEYVRENPAEILGAYQLVAALASKNMSESRKGKVVSLAPVSCEIKLNTIRAEKRDVLDKAGITEEAIRQAVEKGKKMEIERAIKK
ncbi:MAG: hypothetical protein V1647_01920 [Pseudomonadota bacterium]